MPDSPQPHIRILADHVCNQIAAGEVIERPASVFKELVENAVDAGATEIVVDVLQGGRKAVIVTDNGVGMDRDSCQLALERHATSKIRDAEDIEQIHTMGFRGEALAAITSVSRFVLESRTIDQLAGTRIQIDGSNSYDISEVGCPPGTRIEVRNLFFNTPARRKFLRTESTELAYIRTLFQTFAIAHPDVALRLQVDGRSLEHLPAQPHLADRIADIQGQDFFSKLAPVTYSKGQLRIHGFIGFPTLHRSDKRDQVTLINRRPATAPVLGYAIRQAYSDSLPKGRHPVLFLHIEMPAEWVDVNVHPTKREVRFGPSHLVRDALIEAISQTLRPGQTTPAPASPPPLSEAKPPMMDGKHRQQEIEPSGATYPPLPPRSPTSSPSPLPPVSSPQQTTSKEAPSLTSPQPQLWQDAIYLGTQDGFHILSIQSGLVILLPRAARERILYETCLREWEHKQIASQQLLLPETIACSPEEARRIREQLSLLEEMGFSMVDFGQDTFLVEAVPSWLSDLSIAELLHDLASEFVEHRSKKEASFLRERLARRCCSSAAAHKKHLTEASVLQLLHQLATCEMPYTTPFGKPTLLHLGTDDFRRKFGLPSD